MAIKSLMIPCTHYYAQCLNCEWTDAIAYNTEIPKIRNRAIAHAEKTGHKVSIEKGSTIYYERA